MKSRLIISLPVAPMVALMVAMIMASISSESVHAFGRRPSTPRPTPTSFPAPEPTSPPITRHFNLVVEIFEGSAANNRRVAGATVNVDGDTRSSDGNGFTHFWAPEGERVVNVSASGLNGAEARINLDRDRMGGDSVRIELTRTVEPNRTCTTRNNNDENSGLPRGLPSGQGQDVVNRVAREYPHLLAHSCVEHGGNNEFLFKVVQELRKLDPRWGLNWKRGNYGDMSQDVVNYYRGGGPFEGGTDTYVIDVIGSHCGNNPSPAWINQTGVGGAVGRWTIDPMEKCE